MNTKGQKRIERVLLVRVNSSFATETGHPQGYRPPWTLKYIEALLTRTTKYNVKLIDCLTIHLSLEKLLEISLNYSPDLLVVFFTTFDSQLALKYTSLIRQRRKVVIVAVGQDVTARSEKYLAPNSPIDFALFGEAELETISLIERLNLNYSIEEVKNFYFRRQKRSMPIKVLNLDALPFPIYNSIELERYGFVYPLRMNKKVIWGHILSSRGCPYSCIFCSPILRESYGNELRLRSASSVANEIGYLMGLGANVISFDDDNFTTSRKHAISICEEIRRKNLKVKWIAHARVDNMTKELLVAMKKSGCILLRFGIESGSNRIIRILNKTNNLNWVEESKKIFEMVKEVGIATDSLFLIGNPGETKVELLKSIKLAKRLNSDIIQVSFFTPYPGSPAFRLFKDRIKSVDILKIHHYASPIINLTNLSLEELRLMQKTFYKRFLLRPNFIFKHFIRYFLFYLNNPKVFFELLKIRGYLKKD